jgi:hypothetical protein
MGVPTASKTTTLCLQPQIVESILPGRSQGPPQQSTKDGECFQGIDELLLWKEPRGE